MKQRKSTYLILLVLSVALIGVALFVPTTQLVATDTEKVVVYSQSVSLLKYLIDAPFWLTAAGDVYFSATGPIWMATASILFNFLVAAGGLVALTLCIVELCSRSARDMAIKNNVLTRKISLFVGWLAISVAIFAIASFVITTLMANGYVAFNLSVAPFAFVGIGIAMIWLTGSMDKRLAVQQSNKGRDGWGFALCGALALVGVGVLFIPQYSLEFGLGVTSLWDVGRAATEIMSDPYIFNTMGDYPFGFATWIMFLLFFVTVFVVIYCLIGLILVLCGKQPSWLSVRVKRWGMTYLIVYTVLYAFVLSQSAVLWSTTVFIDGGVVLFSLKPYAYALMFVPYLPYFFATLVSQSKKVKEENTKK
jgi:hypothetical protein